MSRVEVVADGVYRLEKAAVNCYLIVADDGIVLVDGGLPGSWSRLTAALRNVGATPFDISAVVLTHGHFDHVGMCDRLSWENRVASHIHPDDQDLARHPYRYAHENARARYPVQHPAAIPILARMTAAGALWVKGIKAKSDVVPGSRLDLPGGLTPIWSPGHTAGHCAYFMADRGILFSGDALVTYDPYTAGTGPRIVAGAATADSAVALTTLDELAATGAGLVLTGHGEPFTDGIRVAAAHARAVGPS
ncbi:MBL fold metallo-hydrolase [Microbacterium sp. zg.B48]|uniref:MBL fold metallo-hydrolase n=1 Tax=Microbacterium sp. zg.B48 TaxID=2969408 RepID=UPI00214C325A|nr:MBL fold metallo-hydrolase [Microbacterium sp. zg.B48]MCR2763103.1 MBL fold metallo-hydrolase [Microbacterium sp. zg.B48]